MKQEVIRSARPFERLSRLGGYQIEGHHVDPRGWTVINSEGHSIGEVKDLIVDTERMTTAYLDVELDTKLFDLHDDPHVLVPLPRAHRDGDHRRLRIDGLTRDRVAALMLARDAHHREFWNRWWDQAGAVTHPQDWTPTISRSTTVPHDELRHAIDRMQPGDTVRIPVVNEEIVVEKRPLQGASPRDAEVSRATTNEIVTAREREREIERDTDPVLPREAPPRAL